MSEFTTIQLSKSAVGALQEAKVYPRQTYNDLILHLVELAKKVEARNQYDEFLHKIQQPKMKEIWDNKKDEVWENV